MLTLLLHTILPLYLSVAVYSNDKAYLHMKILKLSIVF